MGTRSRYYPYDCRGPSKDGTQQRHSGVLRCTLHSQAQSHDGTQQRPWVRCGAPTTVGSRLIITHSNVIQVFCVRVFQYRKSHRLDRATATPFARQRSMPGYVYCSIFEDVMRHCCSGKVCVCHCGGQSAHVQSQKFAPYTFECA